MHVDHAGRAGHGEGVFDEPVFGGVIAFWD